MEGIQEPVTRPMATVLRRAVLDHAVTERRRAFPPLIHVGRPGGREEVFAVEPEAPLDQALRAPLDHAPLDHALRCDVMAALLRRAGRYGAVPMVWLTRPGDLDLQDLDAAWLAAARAATAEAGVGLTLVVVTRHGWRDPRSGVRRDWKRLRAR